MVSLIASQHLLKSESRNKWRNVMPSCFIFICKSFLTKNVRCVNCKRHMVRPGWESYCTAIQLCKHMCSSDVYFITGWLVPEKSNDFRFMNVSGSVRTVVCDKRNVMAPEQTVNIIIDINNSVEIDSQRLNTLSFRFELLSCNTENVHLFSPYSSVVGRTVTVVVR